MEHLCEPRILFPCETATSINAYYLLDYSPHYQESSPSRDAFLEVNDLCRIICSCKSTCQQHTCPCTEVVERTMYMWHENRSLQESNKQHAFLLHGT